MTLKEIQNALIGLGYKPGKADGKLGPKTIKAVRAFQTATKYLKVDGIPGPKTSAALQKAIQPIQKPVQPPKPAPVVEQTVNRYDPLDAVKYFEGRGWHRLAAIALTANLMWESGGNRFNTIIFDAHGDKDATGVHRSHGAGQWNERAGRYDALLDWAMLEGKPWYDPQLQLSFLNRELLTTEKRAAAKLREAQTLEEAVTAAIGIWRPSIPHADKRLAIAQKIEGWLKS